MNRHGFDIRLKEEVINENPDLPGLPDTELLAGNLGFETKLSEYWAGLTWAKPLGNGLGLGISTFVSVRNQRSRRNVDLQGLTDRNRGEQAYGEITDGLRRCGGTPEDATNLLFHGHPVPFRHRPQAGYDLLVQIPDAQVGRGHCSGPVIAHRQNASAC